MFHIAVNHLKYNIKLLVNLKTPMKNNSFLYIYRNTWLYEKYLNTKNRIIYGPSAPRPGETIWVNPHNITNVIPPKAFKKVFGITDVEASGNVIKSWWPEKETFTLVINDIITRDFHIKDTPDKMSDEYRIKYRFKFCYKHWVKGVPWEDTGIYEFREKEKYTGKCNINAIRDKSIKKYKQLDLIYGQIIKDGRFRTDKEIDPISLERIINKVIIHIGPNGKLYWGGGGKHRFAIAYILNMPLPARLGLVHASAIPYLNNYRQKPQNI